MKFNPKKFSARLRSLMDEHDDTLYSVADIVSLTAPTISRYLSGQYTPKQPTIESLARHYNVNPAWLLGYDNVEKNLSKAITKINNDDLMFQALAKSYKMGRDFTPEERNIIRMSLEIAIANIKRSHKE